jgi:hypothetical protein
MESMIRTLKEKTGKTIEQWVALAKKSGAAKHGEVVQHLKSEHGLTHGYANLVAHQTFQSAAIHADGGDLIAAQYAGKKAGLRPVYDALIEKINAFGGDIEIAPKKAYVSLRRKKQFAILQPSTADRLDVGINLKDAPATGRLEASGSWNAMVSHRVRVASKADVNAELVGWLKKAYDGA